MATVADAHRMKKAEVRESNEASGTSPAEDLRRDESKWRDGGRRCETE